jgi:hypothetical protein
VVRIHTKPVVVAEVEQCIVEVVVAEVGQHRWVVVVGQHRKVAVVGQHMKVAVVGQHMKVVVVGQRRVVVVAAAVGHHREIAVAVVGQDTRIGHINPRWEQQG